MPSPEFMAECDLLALSLGITPKYNPDGSLSVVGEPGPKGRIYVIYCGRSLGLFGNWYVDFPVLISSLILTN